MTGPWTYLKSEPDDSPTGAIWTVGRYDGRGEWLAESDHGSEADAREWADILNRAERAAFDGAMMNL